LYRANAANAVEMEVRMKTTHRSYAEEASDFYRLCRFIREHHDHVRAYSTWSLGRLVDWKYGLYENKLSVAAFCDKNAHLWFDSFGELAALAISENGDTGFAIITAEGYRFLFEEILGWVIANWNDRGPRFSTEITELQGMEVRILERFEFQHQSTFYTRRFDLTSKPLKRFPLEPGFVIVDMLTYPNYREQRILRAEAFSGKSSLTEEELQRQLEFYNYIHAGPIYHPQCDLCVMTEDGRFVAGCEALIDARNSAADIERVCTHSRFRKRGFARAVIQECLERLRAMGMRNAYITGYSPEAMALYGSLGAVEESKSFIYETAAS
jgi:GNAT superfamily N-acetyltransferase